MADFSKQYLDIHDPDGMAPDFDILEVASGLSSNQYSSIICEGFGFLAIGKDKADNILLAMPKDKKRVGTDSVEVDWMKYEDVIKASKT